MESAAGLRQMDGIRALFRGFREQAGGEKEREANT